MRIGIDARELSGQPTGVGRYLGGLVREWTSRGAAHGHELLLYSHRPLAAAAGDCDVRLVEGAGGTVWEQRDLSRAVTADRIDVLFSPAYSTPLFTRQPRVVALHDISFAARPDWYAWREGVRRRVLARRSAAAARAVVTISEFSKSEIMTRFGTASSKVHVIPPGVDGPGPADASSGPHGETPVLFVGSIFNRRHLPETIAAFSLVAARHGDAVLHLVGDNRSHPRQDIAGLVAASGAADRIHWHRYAPDAELRQLYGRARGFVFLSEYEGLGLTPLEALAGGVPSLLLDTAVARESCGPAAAYVSLGSAATIASALERLLYDEAWRRSLHAEAGAVLARYDWPTAARATLRVLEGAV
ncbi:MAG TPA: glycosyltransferase family 1 protein [Vicinamibacterales bacterium]|nr:glycosyltransferase family 1 protein [Vicinamibacterales bacterium]